MDAALPRSDMERAGFLRARRLQMEARTTQSRFQGAIELREAAPVRPPPGTQELDRWPTHLRRALHGAAGPTARADAEEAERRRRVERVAEIVREAGLPMVALADATRDPVRTMAQAAQGRRVKTIRKRVRTWGKARRFFLQAFGAVWPRSVADVIDYIQALREAGSKLAARDFVGAFIFFERGGGVRVADQMAEHPSVEAAAAIAQSRAAVARKYALGSSCRWPKRSNWW